MKHSSEKVDALSHEDDAFAESSESTAFGQGTIKRYKRDEEVGDGTYGVVYKGIDRKTGELVAIKKIKLDVRNATDLTPCRSLMMASQAQLSAKSPFCASLSILTSCSKPRQFFTAIFRLKDVVSTDEPRLYLIFEFVNMELKKFLDAQPLEELTIKTIVFQILRAVAVCHSRRIIHRDLKP